jgi:hypothetical protein
MPERPGGARQARRLASGARGTCDALLTVMADNNNKTNDGQDQQRQRSPQQGGQGGGIGKQPQKGAPTAGNRDSNDRAKMPPDRNPPSNDQLDIDVGDDRSPQRAPQPGTNQPK